MLFEEAKIKRVGFLFEKIFTIENLYLAYFDARKNKQKKKDVFSFGVNLGTEIQDLYDRIHNNIYVPDSYKSFVVFEPKKRIILAPAFRDTVVQHAIYRYIYDIFNRTFISTSFACRKGYGTHKASKYTQTCLRSSSSNNYYLQLDIRKFFASIDRDILKKQIEKKIKDGRLINVIMLFADSGKDLGIPIGNLLSQLFALIYLNPLDHFMKRHLKIRKYVRYVDDFILINLIMIQIFLYRKNIINFLNNLKLTLSKYIIQKICKGINFVGYRTWKSKRFIRKYSLFRYFRFLKRFNFISARSVIGHAKDTNSLQYMLSLLDLRR